MTVKAVKLLEELEMLLEEQIECARRNDFGQLEKLVRRAEPLWAQAKAAGVFSLPQGQQWCKRLGAMHRQLVLMIAAEKENIAGRLKRVAKGKKAIGAYGKRP